MSKIKRHNRTITLAEDVVNVILCGESGDDCAPIEDFPKLFDEMFRDETEDWIWLSVPIGVLPYARDPKARKLFKKHNSVEVTISDDYYQVLMLVLEHIKLFEPHVTVDDLMRFILWTHKPTVVARTQWGLGLENDCVPELYKLTKVSTPEDGLNSTYTFSHKKSNLIWSLQGGDYKIVTRPEDLHFEYIDARTLADDIVRDVGFTTGDFVVRPMVGRHANYIALEVRKVKEQCNQKLSQTIN